MRHTNKFYLITGICITVMLSCSNRSSNKVMDETYEISEASVVEEEAIEYVSDEAKGKELYQTPVKSSPLQSVPNFITSSAAMGSNDDETHKFIRTAQMKFKVKDVVNATHTIEDIIIKNKGFILNSSIMNKQLSPHSIQISKDSSLVTSYLNLESSLQLKVPCQLLDTTLRQIAPLALSVDYRTVDATDVTTRLMSERMAQARMAKKQKRLSNAIDNNGRKLSDITNAEEALDNAMEREDNAKISEFMTNEKIAYSTISISLYQAITEHNEMIACVKQAEGYKPGFGAKVIEGLSNGWAFVMAVFILLVNIWPILLIVSILIIIYMRVRKKNAK